MSEYYVKMVLVGDQDVGKSSLLLRFTDDVFFERTISTIGVDFKIKTIDMGPHMVKMTLWDTSGQDRFKTLVTSFYRGAQALAVVFSLTDMVSFNHVTTWLQEADRYGSPDCVKLLVGNKCDLTSQRVVDKDTAQALADRLGMPYIETSAKHATNVHQSFTTLAQRVVEMKESGQLTDVNPLNTTIKLQDASDPVYSIPCYDGSWCTVI